jgi:hypothetical protein
LLGYGGDAERRGLGPNGLQAVSIEGLVDRTNVGCAVGHVAIVVVGCKDLHVHGGDVGGATDRLVVELVAGRCALACAERIDQVLAHVPQRLPDDQAVVVNLPVQVLRPAVLLPIGIEVTQR